MTSTANSTTAQRRARFSWVLWDWAEQPYPTLMQTFIFPVYLAGAVATDTQNPDQAIGWALAIAGLLVALISPVLGRRSDHNGRRKFWLLTNTFVLIGITAASFFVAPHPEFFVMGLVLYGLGSVIQESALINYYAMLKSVSTDKSVGRLSGLAWAIGYVGGIVLLLVSLLAFVLPEVPWFGVPTDESLNIRVIFLMAAAWMLLFTIPMILFVPEIPKRQAAPESIGASYRGVIRELLGLRRTAPDIFRFLIASAVYRDGLAGVFSFGAILGTLAFGFDQTSIIFYGIAANIVAGLGAWVGGILDDRVGSRLVVLASLAGLVVAGSCVFIFASLGQITFWVFGLALTLFVGPAQASSRTFVARFTPHGREGEVFGLYQFTGRAASFLSGTFWAAAIGLATLALGPGDHTIFGVWGLIAILAGGFVLLLRVHPQPEVLEKR